MYMYKLQPLPPISPHPSPSLPRPAQQRTALLRVAEDGHAAKVSVLLDMGGDLEAKDKNGKTALLLAVKNRHTETVTLLLDRSANIGAKDNDGKTALLLAVKNRHAEMVTLLLNWGADLEALLLAARCGHTETVRLLLGRNWGADLEGKDDHGNTTLLLAVKRLVHLRGQRTTEDALNFVHKVKARFAHNRTIYEEFLDILKQLRDNREQSGIFIFRVESLLAGHPDLILKFKTFSERHQTAPEDGHAATVAVLLDMVHLLGRSRDDRTPAADEMVTLLLGRGADIEAKDVYGETVLLVAANGGLTETVGMLLDRGADIEAMDFDGLTALLVAANGGLTETVGLLLDRGAALEAKDFIDNTALMVAARRGWTETVGLLLDRDAAIEAADKNGWTALMLGAKGGHTATVGMLLDRGADIEAMCDDGRTALLVASNLGHTETVGLLLDGGAAIEAKGFDGLTALMLAARKGWTETVGLLLDRGAAIEAADKNGWTALLVADQGSHKKTVYLLLGRGAVVTHDPGLVAGSAVMDWQVEGRKNRASFREVLSMLTLLPPGEFHQSFPGGSAYLAGEQKFYECVAEERSLGKIGKRKRKRCG